MKNNVFIFHGTEGSPDGNWFPWLSEKIEQKGSAVFAPQFPTTPEIPPNIDAWFEVLKDYEQNINENSIFVGHSLGGTFTLRVLERLVQEVKAVFLVGTSIGVKPIRFYEGDKNFSGFDFDWEVIRKASENFVVYHSDNDPYVSLGNGEELAEHLGVDLTLIPNAGHLNQESGYTKFEGLWGDLEPLLD